MGHREPLHFAVLHEMRPRTSRPRARRPIRQCDAASRRSRASRRARRSPRTAVRLLAAPALRVVQLGGGDRGRHEIAERPRRLHLDLGEGVPLPVVRDERARQVRANSQGDGHHRHDALGRVCLPLLLHDRLGHDIVGNHRVGKHGVAGRGTAVGGDHAIRERFGHPLERAHPPAARRQTPQRTAVRIQAVARGDSARRASRPRPAARRAASSKPLRASSAGAADRPGAARAFSRSRSARRRSEKIAGDLRDSNHWPASLRIGDTVSEIGMSVPSLRRRMVSKCWMLSPRRMRASTSSSSLCLSLGMMIRMDRPITSSAV